MTPDTAGFCVPIVELSLPMPPSINDAYADQVVPGRFGRSKQWVAARRLTKEGKAFKTEVARIVASIAGDPTKRAQLDRLKDNSVALQVEVDLYFPSVVNSGWPKKADSRYKRIDTSNYIKILEDAIFEAFGVDDSRVFILHVEKHKQEPGREGAKVWIHAMMHNESWQ